MDAVVLRGGAPRGSATARLTMAERPDLLAGEDLPPAPRQERSQDTRGRIDEAALALFAEKGYEATSIEEVAERSSIATGTFYLHYRSKRQLLLALTDELLARIEGLDLRVPIEFTDVRAGLRAVLSRALSSDLQYLGAYRAWREAMLGDEDLTARHRAIHAWTTERVLYTLEHLQRLPGAREDVDLPVLARVLDTFFWGLLVQALELGEVELDRWVDAATHLVHHAMFVDTRPDGGNAC